MKHKLLRIITVALAVLMIGALLSCLGCSRQDKPTTPVTGKKVAYIMQMAESDIFTMWREAAETTAESLGMQFDAFFCGGSDDKWKETVQRCAEEGYDGLLLSHGGETYAYTFLKGILEQHPDLKIVTFDTQFKDEAGEVKTLEGVTQFFQEDAKLSEQLLDYICNTLYPNKALSGEPVNILKVWEGPGFLSAFDRREVGYAAYETSSRIHTLETIAPADHANAEASIKAVAAEALARYEAGEIDAIWCCYDAYANGVYEALRESGSSVPLVSVDICNADIEKMAAENSPWKACATTNWHFNGEFGIRVLALELAGEYDKIIDPATGKASAWLELPTYVITQAMVAGRDIQVDDLAKVADPAYADRSHMPTADWMPTDNADTAKTE